jgi:radical SAM superfamily enzyme
VLKNTDLEEYYLKGNFKTLTKEEYYDIIASAIELIPPSLVIHRLTGDAPKKLLIAPEWSANKKDVLNGMHQYFNSHDIMQGKKYNG